MSRFDKKGYSPEKALRAEWDNAVRGKPVNDLNVMTACHHALRHTEHLDGVIDFLVENGVPEITRKVVSLPSLDVDEVSDLLSVLALFSVNGAYDPGDGGESTLAMKVEKWNGKLMRMVPSLAWNRKKPHKKK